MPTRSIFGCFKRNDYQNNESNISVHYKEVNQAAFKGFGEDSGLMILSQIPFNHTNIMSKTFEHSKNVDRMSNKGFVQIQFDFVMLSFNLINTHLQSDYGSDNTEYKSVRKLQMKEINNYIDPNIQTILVGDLNIHENSEEFKEYSWNSFHKQKEEVFTFPEDKKNYDHIILLNKKTIKLVSHIVENKPNLSDHNPVIATFLF